MLAYILVSKRPVPTGSLRGHPGAKQQLANFLLFYEVNRVTKSKSYRYDYAETFAALVYWTCSKSVMDQSTNFTEKSLSYDKIPKKSAIASISLSVATTPFNGDPDQILSRS